MTIPYDTGYQYDKLLMMSADLAPSWYASLEKPFFAPPSWLFGPVWSVLYILIAVAVIKAIQLWNLQKIDQRFMLVFIVNLVSNFLFSPIQFSLQNNILALADILIVLFSLIFLVKKSFKKHKLIFYCLLPYLIWVSFATILQISITILNL